MARNSISYIHHNKLTTLHTMVNFPSKIPISDITDHYKHPHPFIYLFILRFRRFQLFSRDFLINYILNVKASIVWVHSLTMPDSKDLLVYFINTIILMLSIYIL